MRIVSKFHDYYDIGMGLAFDDSIDYIRTPREIDLMDSEDDIFKIRNYIVGEPDA